ncbi:MAG: HAD family hydrolase [Phycisphaerae bacterium]|jgi:putative hydrolase of the HAD superfamily|nr:HAD family hydrolase [Phycisphaerae bacterium]
MLRAILFDLDDTLVDWSGAAAMGAEDIGDTEFRPEQLLEYVSVDQRVCAMLRELGRRYLLAVVSNGSARMQRGKILRAGLCGLFDGVFISGEMGVRKPDADIFRRALAALDCPPDEALFVGDDPVTDIAGAKSAGMQTCWISRGRTLPPDTPEAHWRCETVLDLPKAPLCLTPIN